MPTRKKTAKKHPELTCRERALAARYIAEEVATHLYSLAQARAIGISRARTKAKEEHRKKH